AHRLYDQGRGQMGEPDLAWPLRAERGQAEMVCQRARQGPTSQRIRGKDGGGTSAAGGSGKAKEEKEGLSVKSGTWRAGSVSDRSRARAVSPVVEAPGSPNHCVFHRIGTCSTFCSPRQRED